MSKSSLERSNMGNKRTATLSSDYGDSRFIGRRISTLFCYTLFFFSFCELVISSSTITTTASLSLTDSPKVSDHKEINMMEVPLSIARRLLTGPGSSPPRCTSKCGRCTPCKPVHVPVPPGTPVTAEYYPEAWRCKCGNKLYMP